MDLSKVLPLASKYAQQYEVSLPLVLAVIRVESNFDENAVSPKGACGLMQLMPATAKSMGVSNPFDAAQNIEGGVKYLKHLAKAELPGANMLLVAAAYNAGPSRIRANTSPVSWPDETQLYVRKVGYYFLKYSNSR